MQCVMCMCMCESLKFYFEKLRHFDSSSGRGWTQDVDILLNVFFSFYIVCLAVYKYCKVYKGQQSMDIGQGTQYTVGWSDFVK